MMENRLANGLVIYLIVPNDKEKISVTTNEKMECYGC